MRILCVSNLFPNPFQPGKGVFNYRLFAGIARHADVRVISPILWTDELRARRGGARPFPRGSWTAWEGLQVLYPRYLYTPGCLRQYYGAFFEACLRRSFQRALAEFQPDLVHACWAYPDGWAVWRLARECRLPVTLKIHGSDLELVDRFPSRKPRTVEVLSNVDGIFTVSDSLRDRAVELGAPGERVWTIFEGTDTERFSPGNRRQARQELGLPPDGRRLLLVGNLVPVKAIHHFIDACRRLVAERVDFTADLLGDGPLRGTLENQIDRLGLGDRVRLRGQKPNGELPQWYRAADLVVLSSESEGIPNVLVEAASCGTPFVATNVGGISEIAHLSSGELVPPGDSAALAQAIAAMLGDPARLNFRIDRSLIPTVADAAKRKVAIFSDLLADREVTVARGGRGTVLSEPTSAAALAKEHSGTH
jgi:glycosyltransferase involved in cell wall biosynthesis